MPGDHYTGILSRYYSRVETYVLERVAMMEHHDCGEKGLSQLTVLHHSPSSREVRSLEAGTEEVMEGCCLPACAP